MVQRSGAANVANVEVNNNTYIYYLMNSTAANNNNNNGHTNGKKSSELLTDADSIDSGTCSDNSQKTSPIPPPLPKKQSSGGMMMTKIVLNGNHHDSSNSYSDSDESETSMSSLGSSTTHNSDTKLHYSLNFFPDSLLKDIRDHSINTLQRKTSATMPATTSSSSSKITIKLKDHAEEELMMEEVEECHNTSSNAINGSNLIRSNTYYDADKYYNFHINERDHVADIPVKVKTPDLDETFAGYKELQSGSSTIRSAKGTVRGVKNRVRNGIATFLQIQQHTTKNYKEKDAGKVIVYTTSMGIVRKTFTDCANVKKILKTLLVKYEERDIFMSGEYQQELRDRLQCNEIKVPQLFVDGQCIGDATAVEQLNETGELRKMLKPYKCLDATATCPVCGGFRLLPCSSCGGSKKSIHRNNFTREFVALKCMNCDEVGLVRCPNC